MGSCDLLPKFTMPPALKHCLRHMEEHWTHTNQMLEKKGIDKNQCGVQGGQRAERRTIEQREGVTD